MYSRILESKRGFNHRNHPGPILFNDFRQVTDFQHGHQDRPVDAEHTWTQSGRGTDWIGEWSWIGSMIIKKNIIENVEDDHKLDL